MNRNCFAAFTFMLFAGLFSAGFARAINYPSGLTGAWEFDDPSRPTAAATGIDLTLTGACTAVEGPAPGDGAVEIGVGSYFACDHGVTTNGGGTFVNEYTILMDVCVPEESQGAYVSLFQTNPRNSDDGECFVNKSGAVGIGDTGYSASTPFADKGWHRLVVAVDLGSSYRYYCDGKPILDGTSQAVDGGFSLGNSLLLFADNDGEDNTVRVGRVAIFNRPLSAAEVADLGGYDGPLLPYLQQPKPDSITINWETTKSNETESVLRYGTTPALELSATGDVRVLGAGHVWHRVQPTGLQPDTQYYYQCKTGDRTSDVQVFRTFPPENVSTGHLRVVVYGDSRSNPARHAQVIRSIRETAEKEFGADMQDQLDLVINVGDIVGWGTNLAYYTPEYFEPVSGLASNVPFMVCVGNHEAENSYYYDYMNFEDFGGPEGEKYYAFRLGPIRFVAINSNTKGDQQLNWLSDTLAAAQTNDAIEWVIVYSHHPGHTELWPAGNNWWVQNRVIPTLARYDKVCGLYYGHDHCLSFGAHPDAPIHYLLSGGGGAWIDPWGTYTNQQDYAEIYKTLDYFGYTIFDFDLDARSYVAKTYSLGNLEKPLNNVQVDEFYQKRINTTPPEKPSGLAPEGKVRALPLVFVASPYAGVEGIMSSQFQITATPGDYANPLLDIRRDRENVYGDTAAPDHNPVDLNEGMDLSRLSVSNGLPVGQSCGWRVRYRDQNLRWSDWSQEQTFILNAPASH